MLPEQGCYGNYTYTLLRQFVKIANMWHKDSKGTGHRNDAGQPGSGMGAVSVCTKVANRRSEETLQRSTTFTQEINSSLLTNYWLQDPWLQDPSAPFRAFLVSFWLVHYTLKLKEATSIYCSPPMSLTSHCFCWSFLDLFVHHGAWAGDLKPQTWKGQQGQMIKYSQWQIQPDMKNRGVGGRHRRQQKNKHS